jgi:hypothetical protein
MNITDRKYPKNTNNTPLCFTSTSGVTQQKQLKSKECNGNDTNLQDVINNKHVEIFHPIVYIMTTKDQDITVTHNYTYFK